MTDEERKEVETQMGDLRNNYEETIAGLKARIAELEKLLAAGEQPTKKTASGSKK